MIEYDVYSEKSYNDLVAEQYRLDEKYHSIETECLKDNLSYADFCNKAHDVKEKMFVVDKFIRLKADPILTYGKEWSGTLYTIEEFKRLCDENRQVLTDEDGFGYYATETAKSSVIIKPSDVVYDMVRTDFTHVLWFGKIK